MAQTNYTPISLYYSTTAAAVPTAGNLANGELGLNIADMKLYAKNSAGVVTLLASNASTTGVDSISFGTTGLTPSTSSTGAVVVAGTLSVGNGGTGQITYSDGQLLIGNTSTGSLVKANLTAGSGVSITNTAGGITIAATGSGGTVTSVSWAGGIVSVANGTTTPAFSVAGSSGGIPYFSSGSTWASSTELTQYGIVYGGGAGAAPATTAVGTAGQVLTSNGTGVAPTFQTASGGITTGKSIAMAMIFGF
jgi:hypothetical protein